MLFVQLMHCGSLSVASKDCCSAADDAGRWGSLSGKTELTCTVWPSQAVRLSRAVVLLPPKLRPLWRCVTAADHGLGTAGYEEVRETAGFSGLRKLKRVHLSGGGSRKTSPECGLEFFRISHHEPATPLAKMPLISLLVDRSARWRQGWLTPIPVASVVDVQPGGRSFFAAIAL